MAVKSICSITHTCGHQADRDLSDRAADRRAGGSPTAPTSHCRSVTCPALPPTRRPNSSPLPPTGPASVWRSTIPTTTPPSRPKRGWPPPT